MVPCIFFLSVAPPPAGNLIVGWVPDKVCRVPSWASSVNFLFSAISGTVSIRHGPIDLETWRLFPSVILEGDPKTLSSSKPFDTISGTFSGVPTEVPGFSKSWDPCSNPGISLSFSVPPELARFFNIWDRRSWSFVWSELFAAICVKQNLWSQMSMPITRLKKW